MVECMVFECHEGRCDGGVSSGHPQARWASHKRFSLNLGYDTYIHGNVTMKDSVKDPV
jgi:hypothetical protein